MFRRALAVAIIALAGMCAWAPLPASVVERYYSLGVYPGVQHVLTPATNLLPFAFLDVLLIVIVVAVVWTGWRVVRQVRRAHSGRPLVGYGWSLLTATALCYVLFLAFWGFNYRRQSMWQRVELTSVAPDHLAVTALAREAVTQLNRLHAAAHQEGWLHPEWRDTPLRTAFSTTQQLLSDARPAVPGRVKATLLGTYFRWSSVDGMVNPFGLEVLANPDLMPWERPFVAAHEWAHLAGYAHEAEANFVGWLTCVRANPPAQYSGWLFLYWQIAGEMAPGDRDDVSNALEAGPRADLSAIAERLRRGQFPFLRIVSWRVYDGYLKANRVPEGVQSYGEVLTLILRTRFTDGWVPVRRH